MTIAELFITLGVKGVGLGTLKDVAKTVANLPIDAAAAIAGMAGISLELGKLAQEAMATAVGLQAFSNQTGLSWQELQKWQLVAEQANVSAETMATSINTLERNLAEIRLGRGNIAPFQMLGIDPRQNAFGVLGQLRERIKGLNPATATNMVAQMGLSPEMMNVLKLSDQQFTQFSNHVHGLNERQYQDFLKSKQAIVQFGLEFRYTMFDVISHLVGVVEKVTAFKGVLQQLGIVAIAAAVYFAPVTASLAALLLVLDDLAVYATGGKSLTGEGLKGLNKFFADLTHEKDFSILDKLDHLATVFERIDKAAYSAGTSVREAIRDFIHLNPSEMFQALRSGSIPTSGGSSNPTVTVNLHVAGEASQLDAPGWSTVASMIKRTVEDAHLQLNN